MARLSYVAEAKDLAKLGDSKIPIVIDDNLYMAMEMDTEFVAKNICPTKAELQGFHRKYRSLTEDELNGALQVGCKEFSQMISQMVPCVGCRRSIEVVHSHSQSNGVASFFPMHVKKDGTIYLDKSCSDILSLWNLFNNTSRHKQNTLEFLKKSKPGRRCDVHSMDTQRFRSVSAWLDVWEAMDDACQDHTLIIDSSILLICIGDYLDKHRFCDECKGQVLKAYNVLMGDEDGDIGLGYNESLYEDLRICPDRNIHISTCTAVVSSLITRCIPELGGGRRERHAKTQDIAQEEVLICLGLCIFERLHRIHMRFSAEERSWELMMCVGIQCLKQSFDMAVEKKFGTLELDQLCKEFEDLDKAKEKREKEERKARLKKKNVAKAQTRQPPPATVAEKNRQVKREPRVEVKEEEVEEVVEPTAGNVKTGKKKRKKNKTAKKKAKMLEKMNAESLALLEAVTPPDSPKSERSRSPSLKLERSRSASPKSEPSRSPSPTGEPPRSLCSPLAPGVDCGYSSGNNVDTLGCSSPEGLCASTANDEPQCVTNVKEDDSFLRSVCAKSLLASAGGDTSGRSTPGQTKKDMNESATEYRSLEEQLDDGSGTEDEYEIPEEELLAYQGPEWRSIREECRRNMQLNFQKFMEQGNTSSTAGESKAPVPTVYTAILFAEIKVLRGEIREPTADSKDSTGEIKDSTEEIKDSTEEIKDSTGEIKDSTGEIKDSTGEIKDSTGEIKDSTGEIKDSTGEIKDSTGEIKDSTGEIKDSTEEIKDSTGEIKDSTGEIKDSTGEIKDSTGEIKDSTGEIKAKAPTGEIKVPPREVTVPTGESKLILQNTSAKSNARPIPAKKPVSTQTEFKETFTYPVKVEENKQEKENKKCEREKDEDDDHEQPGCGGPLRWCMRKRV